MFREVAHTYYSPNPKHSVWDGEKMWTIYAADAAHVATQTDVAVYEDFQDLNQKLIEKGMDVAAADTKAGAAIAKKYHLAKDWRLPMGNMTISGDGIPRDSLSVDGSAESASLGALDKCMNGKVIRMLTTCDDA